MAYVLPDLGASKQQRALRAICCMAMRPSELLEFGRCDSDIPHWQTFPSRSSLERGDPNIDHNMIQSLLWGPLPKKGTPNFRNLQVCSRQQPLMAFADDALGTEGRDPTRLAGEQATAVVR